MMTIERYKGCLLGLAVGDAVGTTLEFRTRGLFEPITDMIGGGPFNLKVGQWTDDTSMALCLGASLIHKKGFDAVDQMNRYCQWRDKGYMSSTGHCFDIGYTVSYALSVFKQTGQPFCGSDDKNSAGNGCLMRLAPIPMFFAASFYDCIFYAAESARTTHAALECIDATKYFASVLYKALTGTLNKGTYNTDYMPETSAIAAIANGCFINKNQNNIKGTGYVVESVEAALWAFHTTDCFKSAILCAANLGDDADTTAAICGQIAGAYYGVNAIPDAWLNKLYMKDKIEKMAIDLSPKK